nr:MAG TPA: hypothetical protein [Caudoviricetes sp.]
MRIINAIVYDAVAYFYLTIELISIAFISHYVIIKLRIKCVVEINRQS